VFSRQFLWICLLLHLIKSSQYFESFCRLLSASQSGRVTTMRPLFISHDFFNWIIICRVMVIHHLSWYCGQLNGNNYNHINISQHHYEFVGSAKVQETLLLRCRCVSLVRWRLIASKGPVDFHLDIALSWIPIIKRDLLGGNYGSDAYKIGLVKFYVHFMEYNRHAGKLC
jgi:hypothetical protein